MKAEVENIVDLLAANFDSNISLDNNEDGSKVVTLKLADGQITPLENAVASLIAKNANQRSNARIRGLHIDKTSHRVYINSTEVSFTAKEFDLLVLLASNPNRVFSKAELFERLWGMDSLGDIATVTVHIGKLREKIELVPSNPQYIETIWGMGYRFKM